MNVSESVDAVELDTAIKDWEHSIELDLIKEKEPVKNFLFGLVLGLFLSVSLLCSYLLFCPEAKAKIATPPNLPFFEFMPPRQNNLPPFERPKGPAGIDLFGEDE